ncbi:hypothetical protein [Aquimarina aquimarini]|uniref:hypothetical protein n=1 Tax=Aquimarina aquimarini TaxID=1191734 RepID=UPI000D557A46|nr:hypothetical protein [Aquimarina aquimarini]
MQKNINPIINYLNLLILIILFSSCKNQKECEVCELIKSNEIIEKYESCETEVMKVSKAICDEMAKTDGIECKCRKKDKINTDHKKETFLLKTVDDAREYVAKSFNKKEENLLISDKLNDAMGLNMALIGDLILRKGYRPNGYEQKEGYRIYKYKKSDGE